MKQTDPICARCVLPASYPRITFDEEGICSLCREHQARWGDWEGQLPERRNALEQICADAKRRNKPFDVLVPLSGGKDSTYVLLFAVRELGLKCLAYTLDNGYLTPHARANIERACRILGVEHVYYTVDPVLMSRLYAFFLRKTGNFCAVCMRAMSMAMARVADMYDVPLVFGGSSARTEVPLTAEMFTSGPVPYFRNVIRGDPMAPECAHFLYRGSLKRRIGYRIFWWGTQRRLRGYAWLDLPWYVPWGYDAIFNAIRDELGWESPEGDVEHSDCALHPANTYLHNRRFPGLELERLTMARLIMAGQMTRDEALRQLPPHPETLDKPPGLEQFLRNIDMTRDEFERIVDAGPRHVPFQTQPGKLFTIARAAKRAAFRAVRIDVLRH